MPKDKAPAPPISVPEIYKRSLKKNWRGYSAAYTLTLSEIGVNLINPVLFIKFIEAITSYDEVERNDALKWLGAYIGSVLGAEVLSLSRDAFLTKISTELADTLGVVNIDASFRLPIERGVAPANTQTLANFGAAWALRGALAVVNGIHGKIIPAFLEMIGICVIVSYYYGWVGAIVAGGLFVHLLSLAIGTPLISKTKGEWMVALYAIYGDILSNIIPNHDVVNYFGKRDQVVEEFSDLLTRADSVVNRAVLSKTLASFMQATLAYSAAIVGMGLYFIYKPESSENLTETDIFLIILYLASFRRFFTIISEEMTNVLAEGGGLQTLNQYLLSVEDESSKPTLKISRETASIEFKSVNLAIKDPTDPTIRTYILRRVSASVSAGKVIFIVGPSGAGKTSIIRSFMRDEKITASSTITVNGQDIREVNKDTLVAAIGIVPQNAPLADGTVRENVLFGLPKDAIGEDGLPKDSTTTEFYHQVIKITGLEALSERQNFTVGQQGTTVSGGERQRIAIARALMKNPHFLVLDEATGALDPQSKENIHALLAESIAKIRCTTLWIMHDIDLLEKITTSLQSFEISHEIWMMEGGQLIQKGTYQELMQDKNGAFFERMCVAEVKAKFAAKLQEELGELQEQFSVREKLPLHIQDDDTSRRSSEISSAITNTRIVLSESEVTDLAASSWNESDGPKTPFLKQPNNKPTRESSCVIL